MSMIDFPKIDSQGFFHDWNGFAMDRFNDPHLPSAGFTSRGVAGGGGRRPSHGQEGVPWESPFRRILRGGWLSVTMCLSIGTK